MGTVIEYTGSVHLIDDDCDFLLSINKVLSAVGFRTEFGIGRIRDWDVFLVDEHLDDGESALKGCELCRIIKTENHRAIVILMTGDLSFLTVERAFSSGADYFLTKPIIIEDLKKTILTLVDKGIENDFIRNNEDQLMRKKLSESISGLFKDRINNQLSSLIISLSVQKDEIDDGIFTLIKSSVFSISQSLDSLLKQVQRDLLKSSGK